MTLTPKLWGLIGTGLLIAALLIALFATRATLSSVKAQRDVTSAKLSVSNASIGRLSGELERATAEQVALASNDAERAKAAQQALQMAEAAEKVRQAAIDRLMASAGVVRPAVKTEELPDECRVSQAVEGVWE